MEKFDFSKLENRTNTMSAKWDKRKEIFNNENVLPLWVADSDWQTAPAVKESLLKRAEEGIFGYSFADQSVEEAVLNWLQKRFNLEIKKDWLIFDTGVVPAINFTLKTICKEDDAVIIQPPVYRPFFLAVKNNNCQLIKNELINKDGYYQMDLNDLENQIETAKAQGKNVRAMIFCSPHNPVGRVWEKSELLKLLRLLKKEDIYLLSDEIHSDLVYPGIKHQPVLKLLLAGEEFKEYRQKVISYMAASKTFNIAGLHTSYTIIESKELRAAYNAAKDGFGTGNSPFGLIGLKTAYNKGEEWLQAQLKYLKGNYDFLKEFLAAEIPQMKLIKAEGTYLAWLDCSQLGFETDAELIEFMNQKAEVGLNPGRWFGDAGSMYMRLNLACPRQRLEKGLTRIKNAVENL
ncbi:MAG: cystathione beta-lyase [Halanaerobium sp. 4-GBenrich]|uniref:cysteine-S-conjugate beta-lyase n=1 Tax=Halanaerobium congolense TaxID=54121 RepID=A0A1G6P280_9FIRM|nr:MalY/PatB family protein [Halanaerobium congolense]KXS50319.1 MAG: cystathione beta-lyase [Halanaerobium sp. T82-1]ODS50360.1 MAG: cystathione beta-lyase [Halanaerobium sp. 4-GBenrich]PTX17131.1 cystathionine beta-lyase [Halanaerobium congolense]TDP27192.1 cystathionine beta-lyase [Halanaerobium congolense]TDX46881.1 cystathionine beta-lyase [Halanaerobium congolense]